MTDLLNSITIINATRWLINFPRIFLFLLLSFFLACLLSSVYFFISSSLRISYSFGLLPHKWRQRVMRNDSRKSRNFSLHPTQSTLYLHPLRPRIRICSRPLRTSFMFQKNVEPHLCRHLLAVMPFHRCNERGRVLAAAFARVLVACIGLCLLSISSLPSYNLSPP